jgi:hypothetical protein
MLIHFLSLLQEALLGAYRAMTWSNLFVTLPRIENTTPARSWGHGVEPHTNTTGIATEV